MSPHVVRVLINMHTGQQVRVAWNGVLSNNFGVTNGVKQGGILNPILFCVYIWMFCCYYYVCTHFELNWGNISSVKELSIYGINWIETRSVRLHWTVLNNIYRSYTKMGHSIQSVWPKRLSQFPLGRPRLVSYLISYYVILVLVASWVNFL